MQPLKFPDFSFNSPLSATVIDLERLRADLGNVSTHPAIFLELQSLFQLLTSIMSARIEGNRTSIVDAVSGASERRRAEVVRFLGWQGGGDEGIQEILKLEAAAAWIDDVLVAGDHITHALVRELHRMVVDGLTREGDKTPGAYRDADVTITGSDHRPPPPAAVQADMTELLDFINVPVDKSFDLLKVAIVHHRFVWIHPFGNGNGRVARLLTYALMVKAGFTANTVSRAFNPTAVFGENREKYYARLEEADSLDDDDVVAWCTYLLQGMRDDFLRLRSLAEGDWVRDELMLPAIQRAVDAGRVTSTDARAFSVIVANGEVKAAQLSDIYQGSPAARSHHLKRLQDAQLIEPVAPGKRSYRLMLSRGPLAPFVIRQLDELGFLPSILRDNFDA